MKARIALAAAFLAILAAPGAFAAGPPTTTLWYAQPAAKWTEALPVGNGRMGAMVFGGTAEERIQFNEDTLWTGKPHDYARPDAVRHLPELRRLITEGKIAEAHALAKAQFLGDPVRQKAYQPFGDLRLHFAGHEAATDYRRELDLDTAVARTTYRVGDVNYTRDVFASYPDRAIVVRIAASQPGRLSFTLRLDSPHNDSGTTAEIGSAATPPRDATLTLAGRVQPDGLRFESRVRVLASGGTVRSDGKTLAVEQADAVTLVLVAATSFKNYEDISADPAAHCVADLARLAGQDHAALLAAHLADHRALFRRVTLDLGLTERAALPTDQRLQRVKQAGLEGDPALAALYFHYGRYLLIASSRPGSQPANLQGVWNELLDPPWESKWTTNINVEMNYWPAELTNLAECHEPLFDLIDDLVVSGRRSARAYYGARGWVLHHNTDLWRGTAPVNNIDGVWTTGSAWLCHHLWEHYLFSGDRDFLARRAYPVMKAAAEFYLDFLVKDPRSGWLVAVPSYSPEQGTLTVGATMDHQLIRALLDHTVEAARLLGRDADFTARVTEARRQLAPNLIGREGQLQEWMDDVDKPNNRHRHMSPLWALYPGADITPADPAMFAAAKKLLAWRGDGDTGWSFAWRIPLWARVGDGDFAHRQLSTLLNRRTLPNLFDLCGPFQIDGNFGATAGIAELLLQSHRIAPDASAANMIELLPALPKAWPAGSIAGLRARGGFEVDLAWDANGLIRATVRSTLGRTCRLRYQDHTLDLATTAGQGYRFDGALRPLP